MSKRSIVTTKQTKTYEIPVFYANVFANIIVYSMIGFLLTLVVVWSNK